MVHGLIRAEDHDSSQGVSTPLDTPLQRKAAPVGQQAMRSAPPPPPEQQKMRSAPPPPPPGEGAQGAPYKTGTRSDVNYDEVFKGGFPASTTIFATDAPETLEGGAVRVSSLEQALKVIGDNNAKILIARRLNLKDDGTAKLADALKKNKCLEEIYLSQNNIGVPGAKAMAGAVEVHPTLKELYMGYNLITEEGAKALIDAGGKSKTLKVLDVDCDGVKQTPKPADGNIEAVWSAPPLLLAFPCLALGWVWRAVARLGVRAPNCGVLTARVVVQRLLQRISRPSRYNIPRGGVSHSACILAC